MELGKSTFTIKALVLVTGCILFSLKVWTHPIYYQNYNWIENRERVTLTDNELAEPAIFLKHFSVNEFNYENEQKNLNLFHTMHRIIRVNSDDAIQAYNKIYIPTHDIIEIINLKARTINPDGMIIESNMENIKELKDDQGEEGYKIFAIEGVERGSEIEFFYTCRKGISFFGRDYFQFNIPVKQLGFEIISPKNLIFDYQTYNDSQKAEIIKDKDRRIIRFNANNIDPIKSEPFTYPNANRKRLEYKLSRNADVSDNLELFNWKDASRRIHDNIHNLDKREIKAAGKLAKKIGIEKSHSHEEQIRILEVFIKSNFLIQEGSSSEFYHVAHIIKNHYGSKIGIIRLFAAILKQLEIPFEIVMTSDRSEVRFDKDFQSWNYLMYYLIYFPELDQFLTPDRIDYRLGLVPFNYTNNYGLFIKSLQLGSVTTGDGYVRFIPPNDYSQNFDNLNIDISFDAGLDFLNVSLIREMGGYSGTFIQPFYSFFPDDKKKEILEELVKMSAEDAQFDNIEVENGSIDLSPLDNPFIVKASFKSSSLLEKAGNKLLFRLGQVIGPQSELYQENKRILDVENDYNRKYERSIRFQIPEGYIIKNLNDINLDVTFESNQEIIFGFQSAFEMSGNVVTIKINEFYKNIFCEVENFEFFRNVINAAADFNKITLVLEKKS
jgi:hypothetical protein